MDIPVVLVVDDEPDARWVLTYILEQDGYQVVSAKTGRGAIQEVRKRAPHLLVLDVKMPELNGMQVLERVHEINPDIPVIMLTAYGDIRDAVDSIKMGAVDYLTKPFDHQQLLSLIKKTLHSTAVNGLEAGASGESEPRIPTATARIEENLLTQMGDSALIKALHSKVEKVAPTDFSVLIQGESGSGKEVVAQAIQKRSTRADRTFVIVDCGALPESLIESELFGHEEGAFTGATNRSAGYFEAAHQGTLVLDEITNLPRRMQVKLLRALQEKTVTRVGGTAPIDIDVRILCASNERVSQSVDNHQFREDLYYRINEFTVTVPPLRKRKEDILYLAKRFLKQAGKDLDKEITGFCDDARALLLSYEWPGNVRELKNVIRRATLLARDRIIPEHFPQKLRNLERSSSPKESLESLLQEGYSWKELKNSRIEDFEERLIKKALRQTRGNISAAARLLDLNYKTLYTKVKKYNLRPE